MKELWFDEPAREWKKAIPIGNGRLGAMVQGGIYQERLQMNQDSLYYGGPADRINPDAREHLPEVRRCILAGRIRDAEELLKQCFSGVPLRHRVYQTLGNVDLAYKINGWGEGGDKDGKIRAEGTGGAQGPEKERAVPEAEGYRRRLDLDQGLAQESFVLDGCSISKEYLASYPHGVAVVAIEARNGSVSLAAGVNRPLYYDQIGRLDERTIYMSGSMGKGGVEWIMGLRAVCVGGEAGVLGQRLTVTDAEKIYLYLACETSYYENNVRETLCRRLDEAEAAGYEAVREAHIRDYRELYGRVSLSLEDGQKTEAQGGEAGLPVDGRLEKAQGQEQGQDRHQNEEGFTAGFAELYFQYGRYLLISSSRPGSLPANLQGIWNDSMNPPWGSRYTININTQMNYWPAETCSLPECHLPLFDLLLRMWDKGKETAERMYGCRGFVAHHNTDLWGDCAPDGTWLPGTYWVMGGAWLCTHIWQHYLYTGDREFLQRLYPVMEDAVLFFQDFLIEADGEQLICPSVSPENTYILPDGVSGCVEAGTTMDNEILRDLLEGYLKASDVLETRGERVEQARRMLDRIPKLQIGRYGQIMEWRRDYEEAEPGHRHISHLYGLHPSNQITADKTPRLAEAAERTLERRLAYGGGHTGWSCAWIVNFYARLGRGDKALENLVKLWEKSTFPNLMDTHPLGDNGFVFQIDGNLGATAAMVEMLIQSDEDRIVLLPALPKQWSRGRLTGVTAAGGIRADLAWEDGRLAEYSFTADRETEVTVVYGEQKWQVKLQPGKRTDKTSVPCTESQILL